MFVRSIRSKIILWYTAILTLVLSLFCILVYANFHRQLYDDLDDILQVKAEGIVTSIDTYWEIEKQEGISSGATVSVFSKINNMNFIKIAQRWVKEKSSDRDLSGIIVDIFNSSGANIASSHPIPTVTYIRNDILQDIAKGRSRVINLLFFESPSARSVLLRSLTVPVIENGRLAYMVQVSSPLTSVNTALSKLRIIFLIFLPFTILLASCCPVGIGAGICAEV